MMSLKWIKLTLAVLAALGVARPLTALADAPPIVITLPGDQITPVGDPALPDNGAATDVGQGVDRAIDGTDQKYYNRSHYGGAYAGSGLHRHSRPWGRPSSRACRSPPATTRPIAIPTSFSLYGSNDGGKSFAPIAVGQAIPAFTDRHQNQRLSVRQHKGLYDL